MMKEESTEKSPYEAPQLTVVTFRTERGYATSTLVRTLWIGALTTEGDASNVNGVNDYDVVTSW